MPDQLYTPNSLRTYSGQYIDLTCPDHEKIFAIDIAVGLSRASRFGGHTKKPYMVSEHSEWCMNIAEEEFYHLPYLPFKILMHDASEYLLCDISKPLKLLIPGYNIYEKLLQTAIHKRFSIFIDKAEALAIKDIDRMALKWEWENKVQKWTGLELNDKSRVDLFIHHFVRLCKVPHVLQP